MRASSLFYGDSVHTVGGKKSTQKKRRELESYQRRTRRKVVRKEGNEKWGVTQNPTHSPPLEQRLQRRREGSSVGGTTAAGGKGAERKRGKKDGAALQQ